MRITKQAHRARSWRIHELAADFDLLDVWRFDLEACDGRGFDDFLTCLWTAAEFIANSRLGRMRVSIGRKLGWDENPHTMPIPGHEERSVAARLATRDAARNRVTPAPSSPLAAVAVKPIYLFGDEALYEISNKTVHALLHLGWIAKSREEASAQLAVYIKSRGPLSRLYMIAIWPFRHWVVYPSLIGRVERLWRRATP